MPESLKVTLFFWNVLPKQKTQSTVTFGIPLLAVDCEWLEEREENKYFILDEVTRLCFANVSKYI